MIYLIVPFLLVKSFPLVDSVREKWRADVVLWSCLSIVIQTSWMPFPMGIMNVKVVKRYGALDLLTAAGKRGKGAERGKKTKNTGKENRKLCGIYNSGLRQIVFLFIFAANFLVNMTQEINYKMS